MVGSVSSSRILALAYLCAKRQFSESHTRCAYTVCWITYKSI